MAEQQAYELCYIIYSSMIFLAWILHDFYKSCRNAGLRMADPTMHYLNFYLHVA